MHNAPYIQHPSSLPYVVYHDRIVLRWTIHPTIAKTTNIVQARIDIHIGYLLCGFTANVGDPHTKCNVFKTLLLPKLLAMQFPKQKSDMGKLSR